MVADYYASAGCSSSVARGQPVLAFPSEGVLHFLHTMGRPGTGQPALAILSPGQAAGSLSHSPRWLLSGVAGTVGANPIPPSCCSRPTGPSRPVSLRWLGRSPPPLWGGGGWSFGSVAAAPAVGGNLTSQLAGSEILIITCRMRAEQDLLPLCFGRFRLPPRLPPHPFLLTGVLFLIEGTFPPPRMRWASSSLSGCLRALMW